MSSSTIDDISSVFSPPTPTYCPIGWSSHELSVPEDRDSFQIVDESEDLSRLSSGYDRMGVNSKRSKKSQKSRRSLDIISKGDRATMATMDSTQNSSNSRTDRTERGSSPLKIGYEKPRFFCINFKTTANIGGILLLLLLVGEAHYLAKLINFKFSKIFGPFSGSNDEFAVLDVAECLIILASIFGFLHLVLIFFAPSVNSAGLLAFFSFLVALSVGLAHNYVWTGYEESYSKDSEHVIRGTHLRDFRIMIFMHTMNTFISVVIFFTSLAALFIEFKATKYAISY